MIGFRQRLGKTDPRRAPVLVVALLLVSCGTVYERDFDPAVPRPLTSNRM